MAYSSGTRMVSKGNIQFFTTLCIFSGVFAYITYKPGILGLRYGGRGPDHVSVKDVLSGKAKEGDYVTVQGHN